MQLAVQDYICTLMRTEKRRRQLKRTISLTYYLIRNIMTYDNFQKEVIVCLLAIMYI